MWRALCLRLLITITLSGPAYASVASTPSPPIWTQWGCPRKLLEPSPFDDNPVPRYTNNMFLVQPQHVYATDGFKDQPYCCYDQNSFIDRQGRCGKFLCGTSSDSFSICEDIPDAFLPYAQSKYFKDLYDEESSKIYSRQRRCCTEGSQCLRIENVPLSPYNDTKENARRAEKMFLCTPRDGDTFRPTSFLEARRSSAMVDPATPVPAVDISRNCDGDPCGAHGICTLTYESYSCFCPIPIQRLSENSPRPSRNCTIAVSIASTWEDARQTILAAIPKPKPSEVYQLEPIFDGEAIVAAQGFPCPPGYECPSYNVSVPCTRPGSYCPGGYSRAMDCPGGMYCETPSVALPCPNGMWCPEPSAIPAACPEGFVCFQQPPTLDRYDRWYIPGSVRQACSLLAAHRAIGYDIIPGREDFVKNLHQAPVTCPPNSSALVALPAGNCADGAKCRDYPDKNFVCPQCKPGFACPPLCDTPLLCQAGWYCPDGKEAMPCPRGHECPGDGLVTPLKCKAGTYQPEEMYAISADERIRANGYKERSGPLKVDGLPIECKYKCEEWYWNADGATHCDSLSSGSIILIVVISISSFPLLIGPCFICARWRPQYLILREAAVKEHELSWKNRSKVAQQLLIQRVVRNVLAPMLSLSFSSPDEDDVAAGAADGNTPLLQEYRSFLSATLLEFLQSPDCPPVIWLVCRYPFLQQIELHTHLADGIKAEVLEQFKPFSKAYLHAQQSTQPARQVESNSSSMSVMVGSEAASSVPFTVLPSDVVKNMTVDIRSVLEAEFFLFADSWLHSKCAMNSSIQNCCSSIFGGIHPPSAGLRHTPPELPKIIWPFVIDSLAPACCCKRKNMYDAPEAISLSSTKF